MRLIDADALKGHIATHRSVMCPVAGVLKDIDRLPTVDAVEVVRCKDCELGSMNKFAKESGIVYCKHYLCSMQADDFCSYGDRRDGD